MTVENAALVEANALQRARGAKATHDGLVSPTSWFALKSLRQRSNWGKLTPSSTSSERPWLPFRRRLRRWQRRGRLTPPS